MDELRFDGRVAVITGAGGGLGRAYAHLLAARGARVVVNDLGTTIGGAGTDSGRAAAVVDEIRAAGGEALANTETVATAAGGEAIVAAALAAFGRVDIVINNAGISIFRPFLHTTAEDFARHIDVHLTGAFNVTRAAWRHMVAQEYGRVLLTASSAVLGVADLVPYSSAKAGLIGFGRSLALAGADAGIKVNLVSPVAGTRMWTQAGSPAPQHRWVEQATPDLAAPIVAFLCHENCPVSGELYRAAGGLVSRLFIAETPGTFATTVEEVRDRFDQIGDEKGYTVPADSTALNTRAMRALATHAARP
jgi:NAD(P)-dependent dehydrogenase (short-subunit alcohol dehydrogenase family)